MNCLDVEEAADWEYDAAADQSSGLGTELSSDEAAPLNGGADPKRSPKRKGQKPSPKNIKNKGPTVYAKP